MILKYLPCPKIYLTETDYAKTCDGIYKKQGKIPVWKKSVKIESVHAVIDTKNIIMDAKYIKN